jgi:hypothetical protein
MITTTVIYCYCFGCLEKNLRYNTHIHHVVHRTSSTSFIVLGCGRRFVSFLFRFSLFILTRVQAVVVELVLWWWGHRLLRGGRGDDDLGKFGLGQHDSILRGSGRLLLRRRRRLLCIRDGGESCGRRRRGTTAKEAQCQDGLCGHTDPKRHDDQRNQDKDVEYVQNGTGRRLARNFRCKGRRSGGRTAIAITTIGKNGKRQQDAKQCGATKATDGPPGASRMMRHLLRTVVLAAGQHENDQGRGDQNRRNDQAGHRGKQPRRDQTAGEIAHVLELYVVSL